MVPRFGVGEPVQTALGKGIVRELRGSGHVVVEIAGRKVVLDGATLRPLDPPPKPSRKRRAAEPYVYPKDQAEDRRAAPAEIDLHGLFVADALARVEAGINDALLAGRLQLRIIHGRSGGRIRAALHRELRLLPPVRAFRLDPHNDGVTIVDF
jgi:dsDNA-specific endonuclease/ATPase MutS2